MKLWTKSSWKPKKQRVFRQNSFNLFPSKTFIQISYVYIVRNIKPYRTQLILNCVFLQTMYVNHSKRLTSQKLSSSLDLFGLKSWVCYSRWEDRAYCLPCVLFGHKIVGKSLQKTTSNVANSNKNIQKTSKFSNRKNKKTQILFYIFSAEYTLFLTPSFLWMGMNIPKNWVGGKNQFFKKIIKTKGDGREKIQNL